MVITRAKLPFFAKKKLSSKEDNACMSGALEGLVNGQAIFSHCRYTNPCILFLFALLSFLQFELDPNILYNACLNELSGLRTS